MTTTGTRQQGGNGTSAPNGAVPDNYALAIHEPALDGEVIPPETKAPRWYDLPRQQREELTARLNAANDDLVAGIRTTVEKAAVLGELLIEAKALFRHGEWTDWLEKNTKIQSRMATNYMVLAAELPRLSPSKRKRVSGLGIKGALAELRHIR
jgi:hypothetical protein